MLKWSYKSKSILKLFKNYFGLMDLLVHILRNPKQFSLQNLDLHNLNYVQFHKTSIFENEHILNSQIKILSMPKVSTCSKD